MSVRPPRKTAIRQALLSLTSAALCVVVSSKAQASCGHPSGLIEQARIAASVDSLEILKFGSESLKGSQKDSPWAPTPGKPCSGPHCSNRPVPAQTPTSSSLVQSQEWCIPVGAHAPPVIAAASRRSMDTPLLSTHFASSIERPPRGSSVFHAFA
jgi:hypothetical protein